ncbi:hypothetical protein L596_029204 [Steinernema carpocapsae]|uniref:Uncharacterized protein n=1 Tax=Steinernema carpocapsae TaxID=34508 RepID=A0A4U5LTY8_STECR|nr:hypothetical protein L596_029204 [Steinernema carpocapsae]
MPHRFCLVPPQKPSLIDHPSAAWILSYFTSKNNAILNNRSSEAKFANCKRLSLTTLAELHRSQDYFYEDDMRSTERRFISGHFGGFNERRNST